MCAKERKKVGRESKKKKEENKRESKTYGKIHTDPYWELRQFVGENYDPEIIDNNTIISATTVMMHIDL